MSDEKGWGLYRPVVPEGTYLATSKHTEGAYRALLFEIGTNKLLGPPELSRVDVQHEPVALDDEEELGSLGEIVALGVIVAGTACIVKAAPRIKRWWNAKAVSSLKLNWFGSGNLASNTTEGEGGQSGSGAKLFLAIGGDPTNFSRAVDLALKDGRISMGNEEAQRRFLAMLVAGAFVAEQVRMLANARIEDDDDFPELKHAMDILGSQEVTENINFILEANTSLIDEELSAELLRIFGGGRIVEGYYVPILNDKIREALRLTNNDSPCLEESGDVDMPNGGATSQS